MGCFNVKEFLNEQARQGVSDIHIKESELPAIRKNGAISKPFNYALDKADIEGIVSDIAPIDMREQIKKNYDSDFTYASEQARYRVNIYRERGHMGFVFRVIPKDIPVFENLNLPHTIKSFCNYKNGLVIVTGATGSGKSTTLASLLNHINQTQDKHIVTIEDPIEFEHKNAKCIFTQRQIDQDVESFSDGVKYSLRQDPDIILIGEMRDRDTITNALKAAETGHLVFATFHTNGAVETVKRIVNAFDPHERDSVRYQTAGVLRGVVTQHLLPSPTRGRAAAVEVMTCTPTIKDYVIKNELEKISELIATGPATEMVSLNLSLASLVKNNFITLETALKYVANEIEFRNMLTNLGGVR